MQLLRPPLYKQFCLEYTVANNQMQFRMCLRNYEHCRRTILGHLHMPITVSARQMTPPTISYLSLRHCTPSQNAPSGSLAEIPMSWLDLPRKNYLPLLRIVAGGRYWDRNSHYISVCTHPARLGSEFPPRTAMYQSYVPVSQDQEDSAWYT